MGISSGTVHLGVEAEVVAILVVVAFVVGIALLLAAGAVVLMARARAVLVARNVLRKNLLKF